MKKLLLLTATSLSLISSTTILANNPPIICPKPSTIQNVPFDIAREVNGTWGAGVAQNNFGTNLKWKFLIEGIRAPNEAQAIKIGSEVVKNLSFVNGPTYSRIECSNSGYCDLANCEYLTATGHSGYAFAVIKGPY